MQRGRPTRFGEFETIELYIARCKGQTISDLARSVDCDPDTVSKSVKQGKANLLNLVQKQGLNWAAGRLCMDPLALMSYL